MLDHKKLFFGLFLLAFLSCSQTIEMTSEIENEVEEITDFSFLALGDSYTIGQGVDEAQSWPFQLRSELEELDKTISQLTVIAQTGWTTERLISEIENQQPENHDMVSLQIGVNDQYRGQSLNEFQNGFDTLFDMALQLTGGESENLMIISIPDYGVTPFGSSNSETIASELDQYNAYMKEKCNEKSIAYIDVTTISRTLGSVANALASDNLHPSAFQYSEWVNVIKPVALSILEN